MYKITLSDGTILDNIELNCTVFISKNIIDESVFEHNLSPVNIELYGDRSPDEAIDVEGRHENMSYFPINSPEEGETWFCLRDISESEMQFAKIRSDIEYLAMMTDTEL